jgi:hypothetical protein
MSGLMESLAEPKCETDIVINNKNGAHNRYLQRECRSSGFSSRRTIWRLLALF